jgi:protein O-GlcNAc transferase
MTAPIPQHGCASDIVEPAGHQLGAVTWTEAQCRAALEADPDRASLWQRLGRALSDQGRPLEALECHRRACALAPDDADPLIDLGAALGALGRHEDARGAFERALSARPDDPSALDHLARTLVRLDDPLAQAARRHAEWARAQSPPQRAESAYRWGLALQEAGRSAEAARAYRLALQADPAHPDATLTLANLLHAHGQLNPSGRLYSAMLARDPDDVRALNNQANVLRDAGLVSQALAIQRRAVALDPERDALHSNLLNTLQYLPGVDATTLASEARHWGRLSMDKAERRLGYRPQRPAPVARARPPLRVGYVSADFWMHAVGLFARSVITMHDTRLVVPFLYANGGRRDALSAQLRGAIEAKGGRWHEVAGLDDAQLFRQIREDGIDILIDLTGHTASSRIAMFALRPAPVQISWLGYYATTGSPAVDFVILDPWHAPPGAERQFTEAILRLPHNRFCYTPVDGTPEPGSPPESSRGYVTFGSFNNTAKLNQRVLETWARILAAVPDSRLVLKWRTFSDPEYAASVRGFFVSRGIAAERIDLRGASPHPVMLAEYADLDIALDPFPFSGGHTSCEALWMGVPIVTLPQERVVSRQTLSFLAAIGLQHMAADSVDDYVARAVALARDASRRARLRRTLRDALRRSPLCDTHGFARDVDALLQDAWHRITQEAPPREPSPPPNAAAGLRAVEALAGRDGA